MKPLKPSSMILDLFQKWIDVTQSFLNVGYTASLSLRDASLIGFTMIIEVVVALVGIWLFFLMITYFGLLVLVFLAIVAGIGAGSFSLGYVIKKIDDNHRNNSGIHW